MAAVSKHIASAPAKGQPVDRATGRGKRAGRAVAPELSLAQASLRFAGFLISNGQIIDSISEASRVRIISVLIDSLRGCSRRDKVTINLTIWCFTVQSFETAFSARAADVLDALDTVRDAEFNSKSIEHETLRCYLRLLQLAGDAMAAKALGWGLESIKSLVSDAIGVRKVALQVLEHGGAFVEAALEGNAEGAFDLTAFLKDEAIFEQFERNNKEAAKAGAENVDEFKCKASAVLVSLLGHNLQDAVMDNANKPSVNRLSNCLGNVFQSKKSGDVMFALDAWSKFVRALFMGKVTAKVIKFLLLPLLAPKLAEHYDRNAVLQRRRIEVWQQLVQGLTPAQQVQHFDIAIKPLLAVLFPKVTSGPAEEISRLTVKLAQGVEDIAFEVINMLLANEHYKAGEEKKHLDQHLDLFCACVKASFSKSAVRRTPDKLDPKASRETFAAMCGRFMGSAPTTSKQAVKAIATPAAEVFVRLLSVALESRADTSVDGSVTLGLLQSLLEHAHPLMLTAHSCKTAVASREGETRRTALDVISEVLFVDECVQLTDQTEGGTEFKFIFTKLLAGAMLGKNGLQSITTPLRHLGNAYSRDNTRTMEARNLFSCWFSVCTALAQHVKMAGRNTYQGNDSNPDFSAIAGALAFPFQHIRSVKFWNVDGFQPAWDLLLATFCLESDIVNQGDYPHLQALNRMLLDVDISAGIDKEQGGDKQDVMDMSCTTLVAVMKKLKFKVAASKKPSAVKELVETQVALVAPLMQSTNRLLGKAGWGGTSEAYTGLLQTFSTLITYESVPVSAVAIENCLLAPSIDLIVNVAASKAKDRATKAFQKAVVDYWTALAKTIKAVAAANKNHFDSDSLPTYAPLFEATLPHPTAAVANTARNLWNTTFGASPWLEYPATLEAVIAKVNEKATKAKSLIVPGWLDTADAANSEGAAVVDEAPAPREAKPATATSAPRRQQKRATFLLGVKKQAVAGSASNKSESRASKRKAVSTAEPLAVSGAKAINFVDIPSSPAKKRILTDHQKERSKEQRQQRRERPPTYTNDDESQAQETQMEDTEGAEDDGEDIAPTASVSATAVAATTDRTGEQSALRTRAERSSDSSDSSVEAGAKSPAVSILKRKRSGELDKGGHADKSRRVSFDLTANMNYVVERDMPLSAFRKADFLLTRSSRTGKAAVKSSKSSLALLASPPPAGLSPMITKPSRRSNLEAGGGGFAGSPVRSKARRVVSIVSAADQALETPQLMNGRTGGQGVQRSLEPAFVSRGSVGSADGDDGTDYELPRPGAQVFPGLSTCTEPVAHVLTFFQTKQRRGVNQLLAARKVHTVGDICALSREKFATLPLRMTQQTTQDLAGYLGTLAARSATTPSPLSRLGRRGTLSLSPLSPALGTIEGFTPAKMIAKHDVFATPGPATKSAHSVAPGREGIESPDDDDEGGKQMMDTLRALTQQSASMQGLSKTELMAMQQHLSVLMTATKSNLGN